MNNILFDKKVRSKKKSFWHLFEPSYYENEKISFKEKVYTFRYNLEKTGFTTKGEMDWAERMMAVDYKKFSELGQQFIIDYKEFEMGIPKTI